MGIRRAIVACAMLSPALATDDMWTVDSDQDSRASMSISGTDIANFALQLECLEAEFYSYAAFGRGLTAEQRAGGPEPIGGEQAQLTEFGMDDGVVGAKAFGVELANDEIAHVDRLRAILGDAAVACPLIDIGPAFAAAANAAAGAELEPPFSPYADDVSFLLGGFIFEDVGVTAYRGAVNAAAALLPAAAVGDVASILAVEAYHAGALRAFLQQADAVGTTPYGPVSAVAGLISDLRDSADGDDDLDQGIIDDNGEPNLVPTDAASLVFARSIPQVLNIVYLGGEEAGGFFPEGINGLFGELSRAELETALADLTASLAPMATDKAPDGGDGMYGDDGDAGSDGRRERRERPEREIRERRPRGSEPADSVPAAGMVAE